MERQNGVRELTAPLSLNIRKTPALIKIKSALPNEEFYGHGAEVFLQKDSKSSRRHEIGAPIYRPQNCGQNILQTRDFSENASNSQLVIGALGNLRCQTASDCDL